MVKKCFFFVKPSLYEVFLLQGVLICISSLQKVIFVMLLVSYPCNTRDLIGATFKLECEDVLAKVKWKLDPHLYGNLILIQHLNKADASVAYRCIET